MSDRSGFLTTYSKYNLFGVEYAAVDYVSATNIIIERAQARESFGVSALAVHGLIESYKSDRLKEKVNRIQLVVPDGQPVKWALNSFHRLGLRDRVAGPELTLYVLEAANKHRLNLFLYGSTAQTLERLTANIQKKYPNINLVGIHVDRFRDATPEEDAQDIERINNLCTNIVLVGRGCPRQEVWVSDHLGKINAVMMAVGAAFDFHAGTLRKAPKWMQQYGLEWFFRLMAEPKRLFKRYMKTNSYFIFLFLKKKLGGKV
jgi:exopolysaccharide biosynthesis WecB/TagA/CpsF family protein